MSHSQRAFWRIPTYGRLYYACILRKLRSWEKKPVSQRKRHVLVCFFSLLLLGGWSVSTNLSTRPLELHRRFTGKSIFKPDVLNPIETQRTNHADNRPQATRK